MTRLTLGMLAAAILAAPLMAQPTAPARPPAPVLGEGKGQVVLSWDEFVKITGYDPSKQDGPQHITIEWKEIEDLLGVKVEKVGPGTTVDLPWREFRALLEWSVTRKAPKDETPPPADYIVAASTYEGDLTESGAAFILTARIDVLKPKGWTRIPVLPATVAVTDVTLPDGVYLHSTAKAYELLTEKTGSLDVTLKFAVSVQKSAGINQLTFQRTHTGSSVIDVTVGGEKADVKVAGAQSLVTRTVEGKVHHVAALAAHQGVSISWERALPKVAAAPTKLYAETRTLVSVADGLLLCQQTVSFNILHTAVRELTLAVPKGASVLTVAGPNVQDWRVDDTGALRVVMRGEVIGSYSLSVTYEQPASGDVSIPVIRADGVERERGFIGVVALANVEIDAGAVTGATPIDARQLPGDIVGMTNQPILLAYRYVEPQFTIPLMIKRHEEVGVLVTIIDRALYTGMQLNDGRRMTKVVYTVRNNRNQFLRLKMPAGAEIWSVAVAANTVSPARDEGGHVLIPLVRSGSGARELSSFPVSIVYVEAPEQVAPSRGTLHVALPTAAGDVPAMHVMYDFYAPAEGKYTVGWGESGFSGPMRQVEKFTAMATGPGAEVVEANAAQQAAQMQQQFDQRAAQQARTAGATPISVRLPINGQLFKLEKILALPDEQVWFKVQYRDWEPAK